MTLRRRLAKIEETLSPTQLVLRWLAEAHAFGDMRAYVASLLAQDPRLLRWIGWPGRPSTGPGGHARQAARAGRAAVRSALRETVFRFELVMRINVTAHELVDREGLIDAALSAQLALLTSEARERRAARTSGGSANSVTCSSTG